MGLSNMSENFSNTVKTRPPLVVFTVCLLGIIVTTFSLAYYVQSHNDIINSDQKINWLSLVDYFNEMSMCIEKPSRFMTKSTNQISLDYTNITMLASIKVPAESEEKSLSGFLSLNDWASKCPTPTDTPEYLEVSFNLPKNGLNKTVVFNVCVTVKGPSFFMPAVTKPPFCNISENLPIQELPKLTVNFDKPSSIFCPLLKGNLSVLKFDSKLNSVLKSNEYLSKEDQLRINSHLILTSCFLIAIVVLITCFALFNKRHNSNDSKTLLTKGSYI